MKIKQSFIVLNFNDEDDRCIWSLTSAGKFNSSTARNLCRTKHNFASLSNNIWHPVIPVQWSTITRRLLRNRVPFDINIQKKGMSLASMSNYCTFPQIETVHHVFVKSNIAEVIWINMEARFGIQSRANTQSKPTALGDVNSTQMHVLRVILELVWGVALLEIVMVELFMRELITNGCFEYEC